MIKLFLILIFVCCIVLCSSLISGQLSVSAFALLSCSTVHVAALFLFNCFIKHINDDDDADADADDDDDDD